MLVSACLNYPVLFLRRVPCKGRGRYIDPCRLLEKAMGQVHLFLKYLHPDYVYFYLEENNQELNGVYSQPQCTQD